MNIFNYLPYYVIWMQQRQRAEKAEQERKAAEEKQKQAEEESRKDKEESEQVKQEPLPETKPEVAESETNTVKEKPAEEKQKQAEEESRKDKEESEQVKQEPLPETKPEVAESETNTVKEKPAEENKDSEIEAKPVETVTITENNQESTYTPKPTDCELLYEVGSSDYALCENTKAQNAVINSNIAAIFMCCLAVGVGVAALIIRCVDRKVEREFREGKGGGHCLA